MLNGIRETRQRQRRAIVSFPCCWTAFGYGLIRSSKANRHRAVTFLSIGARRPTVKEGAAIIKEEEKKLNSAILMPAVPLNREEIKPSPLVTVKSDTIRLAEMVQVRH
jgi:hypothetical protein